MNKESFIFFLFFATLSFNCISQTLHIYGGQNHKEYLGCLNCNNYDTNSIWNEYGTYGSIYNIKSIWNEYGIYGSEYSSFSPWNYYGAIPPVVVDKEGQFYGYLTVNDGHIKVAKFSLALTLYEYHDLIKDDVSKWYNKIFE
jgi:hypothetical protein